ncbi:MFS transporter [Nocardioides guangzhouensis]|uniref:MFS transporter n=1 Tax=Nocardioides guangzhouensis TaxID=2497878 RepID=UPI0014385C17|nr:MFS transporter [Nocardioides guangzhouensis]
MTTSVETRLHRPGTASYRRFNAAMVLAGLAGFGILYAAQPVLPLIGHEFGVSPARASLAVSASTGALAVAVVPAAAVAARWGRVRTMRAGLVAAVLLTALAAVAPTYAVLVVLRVLAGAALAGVVAVAMGHVGSEMHPAGLGSAMGLFVAGNSLGGVSGRLLGAAVADLASWRVAFAVLAACALAITVAFWRLLPDPVADHRAQDRGRTRWVEVARRPGLLSLLSIPFLLMGGFVAVYNYLGFRLVADPFSLPLAVAGLVFLAYLAGTVSAAVAGRLADAFGRPPVLVGSVVVSAAGLALTLPDRLPLVVAGLVVYTAGFFGAHATASGWVPVVAGPYAGVGAAAYVCSYYAGSSVFGAALGVAWTGSGWAGVAGSVGVLTLLGLAAATVVTVRARTTRDCQCVLSASGDRVT